MQFTYEAIFKGIYFKMPFKIKLESEEVGEWGNMSVLSVVMSMTRLSDSRSRNCPGTTWEQLPEDWVCPLCGQPRESLKTRKFLSL